MDLQELARKIRILAIQAPNTNVMSCEFGNWFVDKLETLLESEISKQERENSRDKATGYLPPERNL